LPSENPLVKLAILLLSFVPNSASTERLFSKMGDIKTKKRSRLGIKKLRDVAFVKTELRRGHAKAGTARRRLNRYFGNKETTVKVDHIVTGRVEDEELVRDVEDSEPSASESDSESDGDTDHEGDNEPCTDSFSAVARQLQAAVEADSDGEDAGEVIESAGPSSRRVCFILFKTIRLTFF
jgi:hypothetical protein